MKPIILFRKGYHGDDEYEVAKRYFDVVTSRMECKDNLVVGRYSCLPFYRELERDLAYNNSVLVNTHNQHSWIADFGYYYDLSDFTPKSYDSDNFWNAPEGQYVVKGRTNSRKHQWKTHMFAENKKRAVEIGHELLQDGLLCEQGIIYREYVPLNVLEIDQYNSLPYANEWRFFYYKRTRLSYGFYWSSAEAETMNNAYMNDEGIEFAETVANAAADMADFFVLDIAEKKDGGWVLIEMNDAQQSGLSENNPDILYYNLREALA